MELLSESEALGLDNLELLVQEYQSTTGIIMATGFSDVRDWIKEKLTRSLCELELKRISAICNRNKIELLLHPERVHCGSSNDINVSILMAFSDDYHVGYRCAFVNDKYAAKHNYEFNLRVLNYDDIMQQIVPRNNATYYKVKFINEKIEEIMSNPLEQTQYLCWIDGDAMVIDPSIKLEELIQRYSYKDLIIAEDIHLGCPINAGILLIKVSEWSRLLWRAVWDCHKYDTKTFYEQSALVHVLKTFGECLHLKYTEPLKSYKRSNPEEALYFPHVCVVPHHQLNSYYYNDNAMRNCEFIFHPYGMKKKNDVFSSVIEHFNIDVRGCIQTRAEKAESSVSRR